MRMLAFVATLAAGIVFVVLGVLTFFAVYNASIMLEVRLGAWSSSVSLYYPHVWGAIFTLVGVFFLAWAFRHYHRIHRELHEVYATWSAAERVVGEDLTPSTPA